MSGELVTPLGSAATALMPFVGVSADENARHSDVRFAPNSRHRPAAWACPLCAKPGSSRIIYLIASSSNRGDNGVQ